MRTVEAFFSSPDEICPTTTYAALRRAAMTVPEVEAVVKGVHRHSYLNLLHDVDSMRAALWKSGISKGDHVGICMGNSYNWVCLFFAISSLSAVVVPVNTRFTSNELAYALVQSKMKMLFLESTVIKRDLLGMLRTILPEIDSDLPGSAAPDLERVVVLGQEAPSAAMSWSDFGGLTTEAVPAACAPSDIALIQYTSGTTAYPKGVMLTHRSLCADAFFVGVRMGLRVADRFHSARPFFHVAGTSLSILACVQHMTTLVTMSKFDADEALELMEVERCTHFSGNDTMALMLINHPQLRQYDLSLRGAWVAAAAPVVAAVIDELGARECVVAYGLSEASPNVAMSGWWEPDEVRRTAAMLPQPGVEVTIRDSSGNTVPTGTIGEIWVRGWNIMVGYFEKPEETSLALDLNGWLRTGDHGTLDESGRLIFSGRLKETIRVGGENVSPAEIEDVLHEHPCVQQVVVVGVPDRRLIEVACALILTREGSTQPTAEELRAWAAARLAGFKVPRHFLFVESFEGIGMTASSKVPRRLAAEYAFSALGRNQ